MESTRKVSAGMGFAAGALFGAIAVFVPLASAGHPGPGAGAARAAGVQSNDGSAKKPAPASPKKDATRDPSQASTDAACDVQLD